MKRRGYEVFERELYLKTGGSIAVNVRHDVLSLKIEKISAVTEDFLNKLTEILKEDTVEEVE